MSNISGDGFKAKKQFSIQAETPALCLLETVSELSRNRITLDFLLPFLALRIPCGIGLLTILDK